MSTATCTVCELHAESTFRVEGMDCREEVELIERRFKTLAGIEEFSVDLMGQRLHVKYDAARVTDTAIATAVAEAGMRAWLEHERPLPSHGPQQRTRIYLAAVSGVAWAAGLAAPAFGAPQWLSVGLCGASIAAGVPLTARKAWHALRFRTLDINVLMLVAASGGIALGEWTESAAVVFLFAVAQMLESYTVERARAAVRALVELTPTEALVRDVSGERRVGVESVLPGAIIVVRPGEKIPLDGRIVAGASAVNQAPVTGESLPLDKGPGDEVFAGSINGYGALDVAVSRLRRDSTIARIIHLVERAQARRAPTQTFVERFAQIYTPVVIGLACATAIAAPVLFGATWHESVYQALVLLVVACPCALVISTPVSIVAALAGAARKGVLIKGGAHLERAGSVRCIAFDKTGTLTSGEPEIVDVVSMNGATSRQVLALAASIEHRSSHPIARAILKHAESLAISPFDARDVISLTGAGAEGAVGGVTILLGNHRLFEERHLCTDAIHASLEAMGANGYTSVLVARDNVVVGIIAAADRPRASARAAVDALRRQGVASIVMLTGDGRTTARAIADEVGIDEVHADLMPEGKVAAVEELRRRFGTVAMVGDGINDAPALASADVGIAMGVIGSAAALETADVALMADELLKIPYALRLSRATLRNIKINVGMSILMKVAFVAAALFGAATLWMAIVADTGASIIVIANALRLLRAD